MRTDQEVRGKCVSLSRALVGDIPKDDAQVVGDPAPEWMVGGGGIVLDRLVLISMRRVSAGCWVPCIRLANSQESVPSYKPSLVAAIHRLTVFSVTFDLGHHPTQSSSY